MIDYVRLVGGADVEGLPPAQVASSFDELIRQLLERRTRFLEDAKLLELRLFARVEAVNRVCPDEKGEKRHSALDFGLEVNYRRFWQESAEDYVWTRAAFERDAAAEETTVRKEWSKERCAKTLDVGRDVLAQLLKKSRPQVEDTALEITVSARWTLTHTTFWTIALGLKSEIDPSIVEKVHQIERR